MHIFNLNKNILRTLSSVIKYEILLDYPNQEKKLEKISLKLFLNLNKLQNPASCNDTKKLVCYVDQTCGFTCQIHFMLACFIRGYYANRTIIFQDLDPMNPSNTIKLNPNINRFSKRYLKGFIFL